MEYPRKYKYVLFLFLYRFLRAATGGVVSGPSDDTAERGETHILTCVLEDGDRGSWNEPEVNVNIFLSTLKYSSTIPKYNNFYQIGTLPDYNMEIRNVEVEDEGTYQCSTNEADGRHAALTVEAKPGPVRIACGEPCYIIDTSIIVEEGNQCQCTCGAYGVYPPTLQLNWINQTNQGPNTTVLSTMNGPPFNLTSDLLITQTNRNDPTSITCSISGYTLPSIIMSPDITKSLTLEVQVKTQPVTIQCDEPCVITNTSVIVEEGKQCNCYCKAIGGYPGTLELIWNNVDYQRQLVNLNKDESFDFGTNATFTKSNRDEATNITCSVSGYNVPNIIRSPDIRKSLTLKVQVKTNPVTITCEDTCEVTDTSIKVQEGYHCQCTCEATGGYPNTLELMFNGESIYSELITHYHASLAGPPGTYDFKKNVIIPKSPTQSEVIECSVSGYTVSSITNSPDIRKSLSLYVWRPVPVWLVITTIIVLGVLYLLWHALNWRHWYQAKNGILQGNLLFRHSACCITEIQRRKWKCSPIKTLKTLIAVIAIVIIWLVMIIIANDSAGLGIFAVGIITSILITIVIIYRNSEIYVAIEKNGHASSIEHPERETDDAVTQSVALTSTGSTCRVLCNAKSLQAAAVADPRVYNTGPNFV